MHHKAWRALCNPCADAFCSALCGSLVRSLVRTYLLNGSFSSALRCRKTKWSGWKKCLVQCLVQALDGLLRHFLDGWTMLGPMSWGLGQLRKHINMVHKASYKIEALVVHKALHKAFFNTFPCAALWFQAVLREVVLCRPCADFFLMEFFSTRNIIILYKNSIKISSYHSIKK